MEEKLSEEKYIEIGAKVLSGTRFTLTFPMKKRWP